MTAYSNTANATISEHGTFLSRVPEAFFGFAVGLFGLGHDWRAASAHWALPSLMGEVVMAFGELAGITVSCLHAAKWAWARDAARAEWNHPAQGCFVALLPASRELAALGARPYAPASFDYPTIATLAIGAGLFSWLALESVVVHRLLVHEPIEGQLVPMFGVLLAVRGRLMSTSPEMANAIGMNRQ